MAQNAPPPRPFGDYDRYEVLGRGGFGVVYRARHRVLDRIVALKLLDPSATADPGFADRFRREAATAARLDHPNIVTIHNVGEVGGRLYIDMRYIPGETLSALIAREAPMPLDRTIAILRQVADALDHAHAELVVHRDVKPANVLVEANGRASLADFGLARPAANSQAGATNTLPNIAGTLPYMAPEQFDDEVPGPPADRYALGVVAYQMLAGVLPFPGPTVGRLIRQVMGTPAPSLRGVRPDLPVAIDDAVQKMLAKEPADRFSRARMLVDALEAAIPKGLVVDASGGGTHRSVIEAVSAAPPGARIIVRPGTYAGPVVLSGTIGLVADGPRDQVIIEGTGTCAVEVTAGRPKVSGLTLRVVAGGDEDDSVPALRISGGRLTIVNCDVSSEMGDGIDVVGARANPSVTACVVHDCKEYGIWVRQKARGTFRRCEVVGNADHGIEVREGGDPVVRECAFRDGKGTGILVHKQG
ncbi:MAG: protein kinase, partial [Chloroflexi bacterium]|nr:protein kinase [Chloroflexota bacterium]